MSETAATTPAPPSLRERIKDGLLIGLIGVGLVLSAAWATVLGWLAFDGLLWLLT